MARLKKKIVISKIPGSIIYIPKLKTMYEITKIVTEKDNYKFWGLKPGDLIAIQYTVKEIIGPQRHTITVTKGKFIISKYFKIMKERPKDYIPVTKEQLEYWINTLELKKNEEKSLYSPG